MAVKKYFANADNTITNAFRENLTTRGIDANMGASDILEVFSIYGQASSGSTELERILIKFPIDEISLDRANKQIPPPGSVNFYLNMYNAPHNQTTPRELELSILPISRSWQEGTGLDMEEYRDTTDGNEGSSWIQAAKSDPWQRQGGDYLSSPAFSQTFPIGNENLRIDVTALVEDWIAGTIENHGVGVHLTSSQEAYFAEYYPREAVDFDQLAFLSGSSGGYPGAKAETSISMWVKPRIQDPISSAYLAFWKSIGSPSYTRAIYLDSAQKINFGRVYSPGSNWLLETINPIPLNEWTHIAVTHPDYKASIAPIIYINGISSSCTISSQPGGPPYSDPADYDMISLGGHGNNNTNFNGLIDDVSLYDEVLSNAEILEIYNNGCPMDIRELSSATHLTNWWVHGDLPSDKINLGTPPTEPSIYDRAGPIDLYASGTGAMKIDDSVCAGGAGVFGQESDGQLVNTEGAKDTYYTKKFFGRGTEFFFRRPSIDANWDSSIKDDRGNFYASSSLLPPEDNIRTLFLYNSIGGRLRNIPEVGTGTLKVKIYTDSTSGTQIGSTIVGGYISKGIYTASFSLDTTASVAYDRWHNNALTDQYYVGEFEIKDHKANAFNPYPNLVTNLTNLRSTYYTHETNRFRFYVREKDWSPTIYTVATKHNDTLIMESASYQIHRITDDLVVLPFSTGSNMGTEMSFDVSGNYFDFKMDFLEPGYSYGIRLAYYDETVNSYIEQPYTWKFRVEDV